MDFEAWFDGACEPINPGGCGAYGVLATYSGRIVLREGMYIGCGEGMTNNVAEYRGCIAALTALVGLVHDGAKIGSATICGDSKLVINQMSRRWKAKQGAYKPYYLMAMGVLMELPPEVRENVKFVWIPRELNQECDDLCGEGLKQA